jgi:hypothetical protein
MTDEEYFAYAGTKSLPELIEISESLNKNEYPTRYEFLINKIKLLKPNTSEAKDDKREINDENGIKRLWDKTYRIVLLTVLIIFGISNLYSVLNGQYIALIPLAIQTCLVVFVFKQISKLFMLLRIWLVLAGLGAFSKTLAIIIDLFQYWLGKPLSEQKALNLGNIIWTIVYVCAIFYLIIRQNKAFKTN